MVSPCTSARSFRLPGATGCQGFWEFVAAPTGDVPYGLKKYDVRKDGELVLIGRAGDQLSDFKGTVEINAPESDLAGGLTPLPGGLFDPSLLLRESCPARASRGGNSFAGVGHGGLPERPGTLAFGSYAQAAAPSAGERPPVFALAAAFANACGR